VQVCVLAGAGITPNHLHMILVIKMDELKTPALDKMQAIMDESQIIGEFIEWLKESSKYGVVEEVDYIEEVDVSGLCEPPEYEYRKTTEWRPIRKSTEQILAEYFEIDLNAVDVERSELLKLALHKPTK